MREEVFTRRMLYEESQKEMKIHKGNLRYGQAIFYVADVYYPDKTKRVLGTDLDCFYDDSKVEKFLDYLFGE
jgi:hypothetical protein